MSQPVNPLIGCSVVLVSGDFVGHHGVVDRYEPHYDMYVLRIPHPTLPGVTVPVAAALHEFRPESAANADPDTPLSEEQERARGASVLPSIPSFGMTQHEAAQYTAQFVAGVAQVANTFTPEGGYLTFEPMDLTELLKDFQLALMEISAYVSAMSVRVARLYAALKESE